MAKAKDSRKVKRAIGVIKRGDGTIAFIERYDEGDSYLTLPRGYLIANNEFLMAKEYRMRDDQANEFVEIELLVKCSVVDKSQGELQMVACKIQEEPNGIGDLEYKLIWINEDDVFERLKKAVISGDKFYSDMDLNEISLNTLLAYYFNRT